MTIAIPKMQEPQKSDIARLEEVLGGKLPIEYLDFIRIHDGATPEHNSIAIGSANESNVTRFISAADAATVVTGVEGFPATVIPLGEDGCGNFFYMDRAVGSVHFWDHEIEGEDALVAPSLVKFLEALAPFDSSTVKLAPGDVTHAWIDPSFKPE
ncbi:MAG: SMI1/KNR4 family protein [Hyphomicrobiaceae bacterium]|nr:SMI1/KNR4 family protein [Hyphomicrobiaceae bacterium]